jgi:hypothetical protein
MQMFCLVHRLKLQRIQPNLITVSQDMQNKRLFSCLASTWAFGRPNEMENHTGARIDHVAYAVVV